MYRLLTIAVLLTTTALILGSCSSVDIGSESAETDNAQATGVTVRFVPDESPDDGWFVRGHGKEHRHMPVYSPPEVYTIDFISKDFVKLDSDGDGYDLSYNPELRDMGLRIGGDGNLHRIGGDARSADDPDEGPVVPWEELKRKQAR